MKKIILIFIFINICLVAGFSESEHRSDSNQGIDIVDSSLKSSVPENIILNSGDKKSSLEVSARSKTSARKSLKSDQKLAEFKVYVDRSLITIGDKIKYSMEIDADKSLKVEFPAYASNLGGFAVRDFGKSKTERSGRNRLRQKQWYIMDTYTTGSYVIPSQFARITSSDGKIHTLKSPEIFVEVKSVIGNETQKDEGLRDIKLPLNIPFKIKIQWLIVITLLFVLTVLLLLYRRNRTKDIVVPEIPAHEQALKELEKIEGMELLEKGDIREYYYLVSDVLRLYLERRFALRAPEQTTEEFLENIAKSDALEEKYIILLKEYLSDCDMVKYAKMEPEQHESAKLIVTTRKFIEETKPVMNFVSRGDTGEIIS